MSHKLFDFINLHTGEESREKVFEEVIANISFRNANLWILACAILIASIGLNVNSTAVIIGAMLISPLMGPIVGAGFALATYDFDLLKRAGKNLLLATGVSLFVASTYFMISPFKETQSELLARTSPNIYDVLIAFLGGLVGVISLTRVNKGNPIPGVAIATALMPPLCTSGYGLAIGNFSYFFGAFYLYTINCFFICIATFFITKYLKYPVVQSIDPRHDKRIRRGITVMILVMILPSFYLAYILYDERAFSQRSDQFVEREFTENGYTVVFKQLKYNNSPKKIELAFLEKRFNDEEIRTLNEKLKLYGLEKTELNIRQGKETETIKKEDLFNRDRLLADKNREIEGLKKQLSAFMVTDSNIYGELKALFPQLTRVSMGRHVLNPDTDTARSTVVVVYDIEGKIGKPDLDRLQKWLELRLGTTELELVRMN